MRVFCQTVAHSSALKKLREILIACFHVQGPKAHYKERQKNKVKQLTPQRNTANSKAKHNCDKTACSNTSEKSEEEPERNTISS